MNIMKITERRIVEQQWYETELSKTGWDSHGWVFKDDNTPIDYNFEVIEILEYDKFYNPILAIAEKVIEELETMKGNDEIVVGLCMEIT